MSESSPMSEQAQVAQDVLQHIMQEMDFPARVEVAETPDQVTLTIVSEQPLGMLIGKGGQTLNAIELLVTQITRHKTREYGKRLVVDAEGYRQRQVERLEEVAREAAAKVLETGEPQPLEFMNARDRRTVHMVISEIGGVSTYSAGEEPFRHIVVCLPGQEQEEGGE